MRQLSDVQARRLCDARTLEFFEVSGVDSHEAGAFSVRSSVAGVELLVLASITDGWDHVSVSTRNRCPNWAEMEQIKHLFFLPNETAMQLHVPRSDHVNLHPYCLHLWRPQLVSIPRPPNELVA